MRKKLFLVSLVSMIAAWVLGQNLVLAKDLFKGKKSFVDEFNGPELEAGWTWTDPTSSCSYNFTDNPGHLRIQVPSSDYGLWPFTNKNAPRITREVTGSFVVETKVDYSPQYNFEGAGILVFSDLQNYIHLQRQYNRGMPRVQTINFFGVSNGIWWVHQPSLEFPATTTYLKLTRVGDYFVAKSSADGKNWEFLAVVKKPMPKAIQLGLIVYDVRGQPENINGSYADFDYFKLAPVKVGEVISQIVKEIAP